MSVLQVVPDVPVLGGPSCLLYPFVSYHCNEKGSNHNVQQQHVFICVIMYLAISPHALTRTGSTTTKLKKNT